jgi:hypothetical protein
VSSRRADSGAGRKLADESCIPNRLELGILLLCIPEASPASSIASLTSLRPTKYYTLITKQAEISACFYCAAPENLILAPSKCPIFTHPNPEHPKEEARLLLEQKL